MNSVFREPRFTWWHQRKRQYPVKPVKRHSKASYPHLLFSCVWLFAIPWTAEHQPPLFFTIRVCSDSCSLSQWCYLTISSSVPTSLFPFNLSQHQGLFKWVGSSHQVAKVLELQHQSFQWIFRTDFLPDWLVWSSCWPRDCQVSSPKTTVQKHQFFSTQPSLWSISHIHTWLLEKP